MTDAQTEQLDPFTAAFEQISNAVAAETAGKTPEQLATEAAAAEAEKLAAVPKTAEVIEAERIAAETTAAEKTAADALAAANAGKTPEQIAAEVQAAEDAAKVVSDAKVAEEAVARASASNEALAATVAKAIRQTDQEAAAEAERQRVAAKAKEPQPMLTAEELTVVQAFEKDFPDVAKAQAIVRRAEYKQVAGHILGEVERYVGAQLGPIATLLQNLAERTHLGDLQAVVPNYDKLDVTKLSAWVKTQPDYLQPGYDSVMRTGSSAQVKDLVTRFYKDTGITPVAPVVKSPAEIAAAVAAEATRKKAIAALAPVETKRTGIAAAAAPADFEGAFEAAARELAAAEGNDRFSR